MGEDKRYEECYWIIPPSLETVKPAANLVHHLDAFLEQRLDALMKTLELDRLEMECQEDGTLTYATDLGVLVVRSDPGFKKNLVIFKDTAHADAVYAAGRLVMAVLGEIECSLFVNPYATMVKYVSGGKARVIADLVSVNVDVSTGKEHQVVTNYAIPLHTSNRTRLRAGEDLIQALENRTVALLKCRGERATVRTRVTKLWDMHRGVITDPLPAQKNVTSYPRLYRDTTVIVPDVVRSETSPQSGANQSP